MVTIWCRATSLELSILDLHKTYGDPRTDEKYFILLNLTSPCKKEQHGWKEGVHKIQVLSVLLYSRLIYFRRTPHPVIVV